MGGPSGLDAIWSQLGSKLEAQEAPKSRPRPERKRCWKTTRFRHRFLKGSDLVLGGFLVGFFDIFSLLYVPTNTQCWYARNATKPQFLLGFKHFEEKAHKAENNQNKQKIDEKMQVLWDIDFEGILNGFWEGFGRPKSMIFAFFSRKNGSKK